MAPKPADFYRLPISYNLTTKFINSRARMSCDMPIFGSKYLKIVLLDNFNEKIWKIMIYHIPNESIRKELSFMLEFMEFD